jgi:Ty3 transposon capsid-like protein
MPEEPGSRSEAEVEGNIEATAVPKPSTPHPPPSSSKAPLPADPFAPRGPPAGNDPDDPVNLPNKANILLQLTQAIAALTQSNTPHQPPPPTPNSRHMKVHEPDQFDGLDQKKLRTFLVQCQLNFWDHPQAFNSNRKKVTYAQSYLMGSVLDWFEPDLLCTPGGRAPPWENDWERFIEELCRNFSSHNPTCNVEHQLKSLVMRDNHRINKYIMEFNCYTSQLHGYGEGMLQSLFYDGLPNQLKDEIYRSSRPDSLWDLHDLAQELDNCYWERRQDVA